jgi:osmotically inducible lipoprotein OsmB
MKRISLIVTIAAASGAIGCTTMTQQQQGTVSGAAIGAVAGAGIAAIAGGSGWTGAAIGGVVGGVVGNIKGSKQ